MRYKMKRNIHPTETLEVTIESINHDGYGIARYIHAPDKGSQGKKLNIYVTNTVPGDVVKVTIVNAKGRGKATVEYDEIITPGPSRNLDMPTDQALTGGTPLQSMKYEDQLKYKQDIVEGFMKDEGFDIGRVKPIIGMDNPSRYRNKMELSFGHDGSLGMFQQGNFRRVIDLEDSILMPEVMVEIKHMVSQWQKDFNLPGYNKDQEEGLLRNLLIRRSFATQEIMVVVYATKSSLDLKEASQELSKRLSESFKDLKSLQWVEHKEATERVQTDSKELLFGRDYINEELNGFKYRIWPDTFFQANPVQAEKLVELALDMADVNKDMRVLDLFCGVGTFSLPLAQRSKALAGIEIVDKSIQSARLNAEDNNLDNTYFMTSDARSGLPLLKEEWGLPDLLLLDPPRSGAGGKVMRSIGRFGTDKVIYVSCSPKTLAPDLVWLKQFCYELISVQPVDQFPHTTHIECVVLMQKIHK